MNRICLMAGMLLALNAAQATELYRWVDKNGVVHYGDTPIEEAEKLRIGGSSGDTASGVSDANISYEARMVSKNFPITLYVSEQCGEPCNQARAFLKKRRVPFSETMLRTLEDFDSFKKMSGIEGVPALTVGRTWLKGFQAGQWQNELDAAGYPK